MSIDLLYDGGALVVKRLSEFLDFSVDCPTCINDCIHIRKIQNWAIGLDADRAFSCQQVSQGHAAETTLDVLHMDKAVGKDWKFYQRVSCRLSQGG